MVCRILQRTVHASSRLAVTIRLAYRDGQTGKPLAKLKEHTDIATVANFSAAVRASTG